MEDKEIEKLARRSFETSPMRMNKQGEKMTTLVGHTNPPNWKKFLNTYKRGFKDAYNLAIETALKEAAANATAILHESQQQNINIKGFKASVDQSSILSLTDKLLIK